MLSLFSVPLQKLFGLVGQTIVAAETKFEIVDPSKIIDTTTDDTNIVDFETIVFYLQSKLNNKSVSEWFTGQFFGISKKKFAP
jgi:hypothetical protein